MVKGYAQKYGVHYNATYAPVARHEFIRLVLSLAAFYDLDVLQFNVMTAFLNSKLKEEVYMEQPDGFEKDDRVCLLTKSLYELKQASKEWHDNITTVL